MLTYSSVDKLQFADLLLRYGAKCGLIPEFYGTFWVFAYCGH